MWTAIQMLYNGFSWHSCICWGRGSSPPSSSLSNQAWRHFPRAKVASFSSCVSELPVRRCMAFAQKENLLQGYEVRRQKYLSSVCPSTYLVPVLRIRDVYPGSRILIFTHPIGSKNSNKREGWKKFVVITFYVATNFTKLQIILVLKCWRKNLGQFSKNYRTFYPKNCQ